MPQIFLINAHVLCNNSEISEFVLNYSDVLNRVAYILLYHTLMLHPTVLHPTKASVAPIADVAPPSEWITEKTQSATTIVLVKPKNMDSRAAIYILWLNQASRLGWLPLNVLTCL